ncbi:hypothetical protein E2562_018789, partial [Oryza meyeriana var. granulata]
QLVYPLITTQTLKMNMKELKEQEDLYRCEEFQGILATSRVIGDFALKQNRDIPPSEQILICVPDIRIFKPIEEDSDEVSQCQG